MKTETEGKIVNTCVHDLFFENPQHWYNMHALSDGGSGRMFAYKNKRHSMSEKKHGSSMKLFFASIFDIHHRYRNKRDEIRESGEHEKRHQEWKALWHYMFSISADSASHEEIKQRLLDGGRVSGTNMCVMVCAILIASVGLNTNSTAVIIGAMLISPLMGSILAIGYGTVTADYFVVRRHLTGFLFQIICSVLTSVIYFLLSPEKGVTAELLNRTNPSFYDVIIASAGGIAGIIGQTRKDKANNIIPGVAIATALMPPLCTCGYSIANQKWRMLSGALYLFVVNSYFIYMSACVVLTLLRIPQVRETSEKERKRTVHKLVRNAVLISLPSIVLGLLIHQG